MEVNEAKQTKLNDLNEAKDKEISMLKYKITQLDEKVKRLNKQIKEEQDEVYKLCCTAFLLSFKYTW